MPTMIIREGSKSIPNSTGLEKHAKMHLFSSASDNKHSSFHTLCSFRFSADIFQTGGPQIILFTFEAITEYVSNADLIF